MAPRLGYAVAAAGLLALCCIVTVHVNDETIRAEAAVVAERDGMMFEHEDHDSDDLSEADKQLIAAAGGDDDDDEVPTQKFSELKGVQNHADKQRKGTEEDAQDELSDEDRNLIHAANKHIPQDEAPVGEVKRAKAEPLPEMRSLSQSKPEAKPEAVEDIETKTQTKTAKAPVTHHHKHTSDDKDELSAEEKALIDNANNNLSKKEQPTEDEDEDEDEKKFTAHLEKKLKEHKVEPEKMEEKPEPVPVAHKSSLKRLKEQVQRKIEKKLAEHKEKQKRAKQRVRVQFSSKPESEVSDGEKKLRAMSDSLSPEMKKLIEDAHHADPRKLKRAKMQLGPNMEALEAHLTPRYPVAPVVEAPAPHLSKKAMMKQAMEKITKAAAHKAVMAATTTLPEIHESVAHSAVPAKKQKKHLSLQDARAVVYGLSTHPSALHSAGPAFARDAHEEHQETFKSVAETRAQETEKLRAKFHQMEEASSKDTEDSWQKKLEAADKKAAAMAQHKAVPLSHMDILRARLMRGTLAAQYRANDAMHGDLDMDPTPTQTMPTDAAEVVRQAGF